MFKQILVPPERGGLMLGSQTSRVLAHSKLPVLVIR